MMVRLYPPHKPLVQSAGLFSPLKGGENKLRTNLLGGWRLAMGRNSTTPHFPPEDAGTGGGAVAVAVRRPCLSSPCFPALAALDGAGAGAGTVAALPSSVVALVVEEVEVAAAVLPPPAPEGGRCRVPVPMVVVVAVEVEDFPLEAPALRRSALADGMRTGAAEVAAVVAVVVASRRSGRRRMVEAAEPPRSPRGAPMPSPSSRPARRRCPPQGVRRGRWWGGWMVGQGQGAGWRGRGRRYYLTREAQSFPRRVAFLPQGGVLGDWWHLSPRREGRRFGAA